MAEGDLTFAGTATVDVPTAAEVAAEVAADPRLAHLDVDVSSRAAAAAWTPVRAALLDHLVRDVPDLSGVAADTAEVLANVEALLVRLTVTRAGLLDRLDAAVSSRAAPADVAAARDAVLADVATLSGAVLAAVAAVAAGELTEPEVAAAVWDALAVDHASVGSMAQLLAAAGEAADPLLTPVPSGYAAGTAGSALGRLFTGPIRLVTPLTAAGDIAFVSGDSYMAADGRQIDMRRVEGESWPLDLDDGWDLSLVAYDTGGGAQADGALVTATVPSGAGQAVRVELPSDTTAQMRGTSWAYAVEATSDTGRITLRRGRLLPVTVA